MKNRTSLLKWQNGGLGRGRHGSGEVEAVRLFDPERAFERIIGRRSSPFGSGESHVTLHIVAFRVLSPPPRRNLMAYRVAAVDLHKKMLAVVVADVAGEGEYQFERRKFGATPDQLHVLARWLAEQEVEEVVMESTAQYWKPVWGALGR